MSGMSLLDGLFSIPPVRKAIWRCWYPYLTRKLRGEDVLFLNYAFETEPPLNLRLDPVDEPHRACIQLYHHLAAQSDVRGKNLLEVSCGHGGGASWITRAHQPASYVGLDLNPAGVRFCRERHPIPALSFVQGDGQHLSFPDANFDVVFNVEASHCYPDFPGFLREVARVLRPGGHFLYADFRFREQWDAWESAIAEAPLAVAQTRDIRDEVLRGMALNGPRSEQLVRERLPRLLWSAGRDFAGVPGARVYEALRKGEMSYRSWHLSKPTGTRSPSAG